MSLVRSWFSGLPGPLVEMLRRGRTAMYWVLEPFDRARRSLVPARRHEPKPPLWIRRHSGPIAGFERAAAEVSGAIAALGLLGADSAVLDAGCGCGSMAIEFGRILGPAGRYVGFDVHAPSIAWCRRRFAGDPRYRFELAPLETRWSRGGERASEYRFPAEDGSMDFVLAKSVFTHLLEREARRYLQEVRRVLKEGRRAFVTAYLVPDDALSGRGAELSFAYGGPDVWWRVKARPEAGVAYGEAFFLDQAGKAGLLVERVIRGSWLGDRTAPTLQDIVVLR